MSPPEATSTTASGFAREDLLLLQGIADGDGTCDPASAPADALWDKAERLVGKLGAALFGAEGFVLSLWPDAGGERGPFLWARLKRAGNERFATHIGVFLSPGFCNLSLDLEKDPLDAGESAETLAQVLDFYRNAAARLIEPATRTDLWVWTDTGNVVTPVGFAGLDFERFMAANRDTGHPWPKAGYLLSADEVVRFGGEWLQQMHARAAVLVPIYDAMIRAFGD